MHQHNVDFYLCGHVHAYERMYPVYQNVTVQKGYNNPDALTHIVRPRGADDPAGPVQRSSLRARALPVRVEQVVGSAGNIEGIEGAWENEADWLAYRERHNFGCVACTWRGRSRRRPVSG